MPNKPRTKVTDTDLAERLEGILEMSRKDRRSGLGFKIKSAILKAIVKGLQSGEDVQIKSLGIFKLRTKPPSKRYHTFFYGKKSGPRLLTETPAKTYVHFQPSKLILKELNPCQK